MTPGTAAADRLGAATTVPPRTGLSDGEARERLRRDGPNELPPPDRPSLLQRAAGHVAEPMTVLLLAAAAISGGALGEWRDATAIVAIVVLNIVIALVQKGRAERALEALESLDAPSATVRRDGRPVVVPAGEIVVGDLVLLQAGDRVPADLELVETASLEVDESLLTGESLSLSKRAGGGTDGELSLGDRDGSAFHGTLVTRGTGSGVVTGTGTDTALGQIAADLRRIRREPTPLQVQLASLTGRLGVAAVAVAGGTFALVALLAEGGLEEAFLTAVALAVAAVPEGLAPVTTVALALGVGRMAQRGAIVRRLPAVETLGAVDTLVIDKTGTVTENRMRVAAWVAPDGTTCDRIVDLPGPLRHAATDVAVLCNDASRDAGGGDPMEIALLEAVDDGTVRERRSAAERLAAAPFTSERKRMSTAHRDGDELRLLVKGAPEAVLARCVTIATTAGGRPLDDGARAHLLEVAGSLADRGERVLALAERTIAEIPADLEDAERALTVVALVALRDPPRESAEGSVREVADAGVRLIMATGDHPATAAAIAREVGLEADVPVTGGDLRTDGFPDEPRRQRIYARVDPGQKLELVELLQGAGHTVAMTGDGVNDAPALRRADIGVALGRSGSDVAREAADLVITDDDLATIVTAVREGRGIYDNLRKVVDYLVASNIAEIIVVLAALVLFPALGVPLLPLQLLWINLLTDGLPALALGVDPVDPTLMKRVPRDVSARLLDLPHLRRLTGRAVVLAATALGTVAVARHWLGLPWTESQTVLFTTVVLAQILYAQVVRETAEGGAPRRGNRWLVVASAAAVALQVAVVVLPPVRPIFHTVWLSGGAWLLTAVASVIPTVLLRGLHRLPPRRGPR